MKYETQLPLSSFIEHKLKLKSEFIFGYSRAFLKYMYVFLVIIAIIDLNITQIDWI